MDRQQQVCLRLRVREEGRDAQMKQITARQLETACVLPKTPSLVHVPSDIKSTQGQHHLKLFSGACVSDQCGRTAQRPERALHRTFTAAHLARSIWMCEDIFSVHCGHVELLRTGANVDSSVEPDKSALRHVT